MHNFFHRCYAKLISIPLVGARVHKVTSIYRLRRRYPNAKIALSVIISHPNSIVLGDNAEIQEHVIIRLGSSLLKIGKDVQINPFTVIYGGADIDIRDSVMIGPGCMIASGNHDYLQSAVPMRFAGGISRGPIVIDNGAWVAAHCTITDGVRIGRGAVLAAGCVVTHDVKDYEIVGGVPARRLGSRQNSQSAPSGAH